MKASQLRGLLDITPDDAEVYVSDQRYGQEIEVLSCEMTATAGYTTFPKAKVLIRCKPTSPQEPSR